MSGVLRSRLVRLVLIAGLALAAPGGAIAANVALLRSADDSGDPVGKLSPRAILTPAPPETTSPPTTEPPRGGGHGDEDD